MEKRKFVVVVGDSGVGRGCLCWRLLGFDFPVDETPSDSVFNERYFDTASYSVLRAPTQDDDPKARKAMYDQASLCVLCYSTINVRSFQSVKERWFPEVRAHIPSIPLVLVGLKTDLRDHRVVLDVIHAAGGFPATYDLGDTLARENYFYRFLECSTYNGKGLSELREAIDRCLGHHNPLWKAQNMSLVQERNAEFNRLLNSYRLPQVPSQQDLMPFTQSRAGYLVEGGRRDRRTLLMLLCANGMEKEVRVGVERWGLDLNAKDANGYTAADYAASHGHVSCFDLLRTRGAQMSSTRLALSAHGVKVAVIGDPEAGKTTLIKTLIESFEKRVTENTNYTATDGVVISSMKHASDGSGVPLSFFDFGGQETLFATHQLFLTSGSIFVLVIDISRSKHAFLEYWAEQLLRHGAASTTVVVCTHAAVVKNPKATVDELRSSLEAMGTSIPADHFLKVDLLRPSNRDLAAIMAKLQALAAQAADRERNVISLPLISLYMRLLRMRDAFARDRSARRWLGWTEYVRIARESGLQDDVELDSATRFLVRRGVIVTLHHELIRRGGGMGLVVLDLSWLASVFTAVVSVKLMDSSYRYLGLTPRSTVHAEWRRAEIDESLFHELEALLGMFELAIPVRGDKLFVPSMAWRPVRDAAPKPKDVKKVWPSRTPDGQIEYGRCMELSFIPTGFLQRILSRLMEIPDVVLCEDVIHRKEYFLTLGQASTIRLNQDSSLGTVSLFLRCAIADVHTLLFHFIFSSLNLSLSCYDVKPEVKKFNVLYEGRTVAGVDEMLYVMRSRGDDAVFSPAAPDIFLPGVKRIYEGQVVMGEKIGEGGFGVVRRARLASDTVENLAIKIPKKKEDVAETLREALIMCTLGDSPYVSQLVGLFVSKDGLGLVMKLAAHLDLFKFLDNPDHTLPGHQERSRSFLRKHSEMTDALRRPKFQHRVALDIARGMLHLHSDCYPLPIIHSDMRSSNVFLCHADEDNTELPVAVVGDIGGAFLGGVCRSCRGNMEELAPEMCHLTQLTGFGQKADVYCYGKVLSQLLIGAFPPPHSVSEQWTVPDQALIESVMRKCLLPDPSERPSFTEIVKELE